MRPHDPRSGGAQGVDGRYNAWRSGAPGPHAHGNAARQVVDGRRAEVHGQQKPSNDPRNNQYNRGTPITGHRYRTNGTSATSTAPAHQPLGSANAEMTPAGAPAAGRHNAVTRRSMRREERVTVQGPVKKQQTDGML